MKPFLLVTLSASALALGACYIRIDETRDGGIGDVCADDDECEEGLSCGADYVCIDPVESGQGGQGAGGADPGGCESHADCPEGEVCRPGGLCEAPTCGELGDEASCVARSDCEASYTGVDCSCGPDCTCGAGQPNCVCASFEFLACQDAPSAP